MDNYIITFDIGGTQIKYGLFTMTGELKIAKTTPTHNDGPEKLYLTIVECIERIKNNYPAMKLMAIGLGLTGGVDPDIGIVRLPGKLKALEGYPLVKNLKEKYKLPVYADNDGRLAAYAEKYFGRAKDVGWGVVLTIGTGVGSGVILDGKILSDPYLMFGTQIGHIIMDKSDNRTCLTGNVGTGEIFCSATALALQVRSAIQRGIPSILSDDYFNDPLSVDFRKVIEACRKDDKLCKHELDIWIENLSVLLINAVQSYAPELIILSGGAVHAADLFIKRLSTLVNKTAFRYPYDRKIEIVASDMQEYAGIMGAAAMLMNKINC